MSRAQPRPGRWPDLLIGLLVLLLLAGFVALLLSQRRPEVAQAPAVTEAAPTIVIPSAPGTDLGTGEDPAVTPAPAAEPSASTPAPEAQAPVTPSPTPETPAPASPAPEAAAPETSTPSSSASTPNAPTATTPPTSAAPARPATPQDAAAVVPADPIPAAPPPPPAPAVTLPSPPVTPPGTTTPPAQTTTGQPTTDQTTTDQPSLPTAPPQAGGAVATSEQRTPLRSDYRVSLGTFGGESGAQGAAQGVRALGYTVYTIDLGEQVVAQIGPFADEATARRALADIQRAYPRAVLYPPRGRTLTGGVSETASAAPAPAATQQPEATPAEPDAPPAASTPAPSTPQPEAATERAPVPSGPVYLQVGAFDRTESAQRLVGLLREQGYAPTVNAPEGRKVTVLIGPFSGEAVTRAEERLDAGGFDHFRVR